MTRAGFAVGDVVAGHRIDAEIGRGGMGLVYRATHLRLNQQRAIKVIAPDSADDPEFRERFERETKIAASIDHPHVANVHDAGEAPDGQLYVVMRLVEGTDMDRLIAHHGRLDPQLAADLIMQVADALDAAHALGLVHRDVKPANVLIGRGHHAFLTDFGLAKPVTSDTTGLTAAGMVVGTYDYMAPEQAGGLEVGPAADVYALAATLFHALAGVPPFAASKHLAKLVAKIHEPAPRLSSVTGRPSEFDAVLARSLDREPDRRHASAGAFGRDVMAVVRRRKPLEIGDVFAECRIEAVAGVGGMGSVYRARQTRLGRTVALKVIAWELSDDPAFRARFEREMEVAAAIDHPNVIPIHWAGEADGVLFIVMRFVDGTTLRSELADRGRLDPARAVDVIEQIAAGLDAAHARGLIHRDVKPANVMIDRATGRVFLVDFGVAGGAGHAAEQTLGTPRYIAPERLGEDADDEVRGDVFSLGCVLWDLLGGTYRPDLARVDGVPPGLGEVVSRAVAEDPAGRFPSAGALAAAARAALEAPRTGELPETVAPAYEPVGLATFGAGLGELVVELCDALAAVVDPGDLRRAIEAIRAQLLAPLRLAVVGPPGSGKTTLIDALPVAARHGIELVETADGADAAEALVVLLGPGASTVPASASAVNAVAVVDQDDERAAALAETLGPKVSAVVPFAGRVARTANAGLLRAHDVASLGEIARLDAGRRASLLESAARFTAEAPVGPDQRRRLLDLLGVYGIRRSLELADAGQLTPIGLVRWLREVSGVEQLVAEIAGFQQRADVLKAERALAGLERLPCDGPLRDLVRDRVEALRLRPEMHLLDLIAAFEQCAAGRVDLPAEMVAELTRLMCARTLGARLGLSPAAGAAEVGGAARERVRSWKSYENGSGAGPRERRVARIVARSYEIIASRVADPQNAG